MRLSAMVFAVVCLASLFGCDVPEGRIADVGNAEQPAGSLEGTRAEAELLAREFVRKRLTEPEGATFFDTRSEICKAPAGSHRTHWLVRGTVNALNAFDAAVPHSYEIQLYKMDGDEWAIYALSLDGLPLVSGKELHDAMTRVEDNEMAVKAAVARAKAAADLKAADEPLRWRMWQGVEGEAKFLRSSAAKVTLEKRDGSLAVVPVDSLSQEDRDWIAAWAKRKASGK